MGNGLTVIKKMESGVGDGPKLVFFSIERPVEFYKGTIKNRKQVICNLFPTGEGEFFEGIAILHPEDGWEAEVGCGEAFKKALKNFKDFYPDQVKYAKEIKEWFFFDLHNICRGREGIPLKTEKPRLFGVK
jgi:hypothetical protein